MALDANATKLTNLVNPEVIGDLLDKKLIDYIRFAPLTTVDTTLVGIPGNTIKLPYFTYIGAADTVAEGGDIDIKQLTATTVDATIAKVGVGVQLTDEAILSGYGDPVGEAVRQLAMSIADKLDDDIMAEFDNATLTSTFAGTVATADEISDALTEFGEDIDGQKALVIDPATYAVLRKADEWLPASEIAANIWLKGAVGEFQGCQVIVSNRVASHKCYIIKPGAVRLFLKRDTMVETDRDIINKSWIATADKHFVCKMVDSSKAIVISAA